MSATADQLASRRKDLVMTAITDAPLAGHSTYRAPGRRTFVGIAVVILALLLAMVLTSHDISYDTSTAEIRDAYDGSLGASRISAYLGMVLVALLLFYGGALRSALRASGDNWFADPAFLGFGALAATIASWSVTDVAMWKAVDHGDESVIRSIAMISDAGFLPLMASMITLYIGTGLAGLTTGALPKWLAVASIVIGIMAPLGPLGFVGFVVLPLWLVAIATAVKLTAVR